MEYVYQQARLAVCDRAQVHGVSTVVFDYQQELLWASSFEGHVTSYYSSTMERYSSYQAHTEDIHQLIPMSAGVISLSPSEIRCTARSGHPVFTMRNDTVNQLQTGMLVDEGMLLVGSHNCKLALLDLTTQQPLAEVATEAGVCLLKGAQEILCCGEVTGKVELFDPSTLHCVASLDTHNAGLSDMAVVGSYLVTCGLAHQYNQVLPDSSLCVFDLRMHRQLPTSPLSLPHPLLLSCMPAYHYCVLVLSQFGQFQLVNLHGLTTPSTMTVNQLNLETGHPTAVDVSPSFLCLAFGDSSGTIHLWSTGDDAVFNPFAQPTFLPAQSDSLSYISFNDTAPLSMGTQVPVNCLLPSDWPVNNSKPIRRKTPKLPQQLLDEMKTVRGIGHVTRPPWLKCNQVLYEEVVGVSEGVASMQEEEPLHSTMNRDGHVKCIVPVMYKPVQMKYSRLGVEDFDFKQYNETQFAGLEIHIPNAYCNSMLQVLYYLEPLRCTLLNHLCQKEFCLACELHFLFRMMDRCDGNSCQASNFLRAFRTLREAAALGLLITREEEEEGKADLNLLIQNWIRFVLQQLNQDTKFDTVIRKSSASQDSSLSPMETMFGTSTRTQSVCSCGSSSSRTTSNLYFSLSYPVHIEANAVPPFTSILQQSICFKQKAHAWCETCKKFKYSAQSRYPLDLPVILCLTCQVDSDKERVVWKEKSSVVRGSWLPLSVLMSLDEEKGLTVLNNDDSSDNDRCALVYDLIAVVAHVNKGGSPTGGLVAHINVGPTYHLRRKCEPHPQWYLFNDFAVQPIPESQAVTFPIEWLTPCVLVYFQRNTDQMFNNTISSQLTSAVLLKDSQRGTQIEAQPRGAFSPLTEQELPTKGDIVGIDAEFVTLNMEEAELRSDGTSTTLKPSQLSVGRVTVVRGKGPEEGVPFIDDYISTSEEVVDYLTRYSGIKPGDLTSAVSSKHLTTLKVTYCKLLHLLDCGVTFVGHGLKKDFRVINIVVPANQVLDTVELFHLPLQRFVSLRFLAWFYLGMRIQDGSHDSGEDAWVAVLLYRKYQELQACSQLQQSLHQLYFTGRLCNWQPSTS